MKLLILLLFLGLMACKPTAEQVAAIEKNPELINDPEFIDESCGTNDHQCRVPAFMSIATEEECQKAKDWSPGDNTVLYFQRLPNTELTYYRIDKDGVVMKDNKPNTDSENSTFLLNNKTITSGDCAMDVTNSLSAFTEVRWQGVAL